MSFKKNKNLSMFYLRFFALAIVAIAMSLLIINFDKETSLVAGLLTAVALIYYFLMKHFKFWQASVIFLVCGYFILTRGFSYIGFSFNGFVVFIGEIIIFISLTTHNFTKRLNELIKDKVARWGGAWILFGCALVIANVTSHSLTSVFKDFAVVYYFIFLLFGYAFFDARDKLNIFFKIIGWMFILHAAWGLFFPIRFMIMGMSPKLLGFMPLFGFRHDADSVIFIGGILYFILLFNQLNWSRLLSICIIVVQIFLLFMFKMSAGYLACVIALGYLLTAKREKIFLKLVGIIAVTVFLCFVFIMGYHAIDNEQGTGPAKMILNEIDTMVHYSKADTSKFRIYWWEDIFKNTFSDWKLTLFGKGFGPSLVMSDYSKSGEWSRKDEEIGGLSKSPHSIEVTILARMGIIGLSLWLVFNALFFAHMFKGVKVARNNGQVETENMLIWITAFIIAILVAASFSVLLESPFMAIPYFFFMGLGIAIVDNLKAKTVAINR